MSLTHFLGITTIAGGSGAAGVPLPVDTSLAYSSTYWQWLILDPTASNPLRLTLSTGGQTVLY